MDSSTPTDVPDFGPGVVPIALLAQCAESKVWTCRYGDKDAIVKHRFAKAYRHASLDTKLRTQRTQREAKALVRAKKLSVATPTVYRVDKQSCTIIMEHIKGRAVRDVINETAARIPAEILRTRANDVFLRTVKVEEAEGEGAEAAAVVVPMMAAGQDGGLAPSGATHMLPRGHGVSTGNSSHPHGSFAITQAPPSAAAIVAASGLQLSEAAAAAAVRDLEALDALGKVLLTKMGAIIGCLHNGDMIHGDLTTANFLFCQQPSATAVANNNETAASAAGAANANTNAGSSSSGSGAPNGSEPPAEDLVVIDFGLVRDSTNAEERAVDLYVLQRAVASAHPYLTLVLETILIGYNMTIAAAKGKATMDRLVAVRARGRKRSMIG